MTSYPPGGLFLEPLVTSKAPDTRASGPYSRRVLYTVTAAALSQGAAANNGPTQVMRTRAAAEQETEE